MSKPDEQQLKAERAALAGMDAILADLIAQRGPAKLCYDEEDGWFLQFEWHRKEDSWMTLDLDEERHASPSAAVRGALKAHNRDIEWRAPTGAPSIYRTLPETYPT